MKKTEVVAAEWPAPAAVRALTTTRLGGYSSGAWAGFNLATHVDDDPAAVAANRALLQQAYALPAEPCWLEQVHGTAVCTAGESDDNCADAAFARGPGSVCAVLTADCLPLLLCDRAGREVAAVHAGWRGLLAGVIEQAVGRFRAPRDSVLVWMGPAIGPRVFEVGDEVRAAFVAEDVDCAGCFTATRSGHWLADLYALARHRLRRLGIESIYGGELCTFSDAERFYSYRRDGATGRMASLIWLQPESDGNRDD